MTVESEGPQSVNEALNGEVSGKRKQMLEEKYVSPFGNKTWKLEPLPGCNMSDQKRS